MNNTTEEQFIKKHKEKNASIISDLEKNEVKISENIERERKFIKKLEKELNSSTISNDYYRMELPDRVKKYQEKLFETQEEYLDKVFDKKEDSSNKKR